MIPAKRALVIINPIAGQKNANRHLLSLVKTLYTHGYVPTVVTTTPDVGGDELVKRYGQGNALIVCVGGDGTLHQVIDGVLDCCPEIPVGYIGAGTTNDFARSVGIPSNIEGAIKNLVEGIPHSVDIGLFNQQRFTYIASCGAFTGASYSASRTLKNSIGYPAYILEGIRSLPEIRPIHLKIETENDYFEDDYIFAAVCNTSSVGGILKLNPEKVSFSDGELECLLIHMPKTIPEFTQILFALQSSRYDSPYIQFFRTTHIKFHTPKELDWSLDGEHAISEGAVEISVLPRAVNLLLPTKSIPVSKHRLHQRTNKNDVN
ncbi:MAG: diacylglycerol kinase family lipid kinase [Clostridia bacterium]|nr:diacylglycerol kinase family lipid kinase [Clostridia bacterium]